MVRVLKCAGVFICVTVVLLMTVWGALAIWYSNLSESYVRTSLVNRDAPAIMHFKCSVCV